MSSDTFRDEISTHVNQLLEKFENDRSFTNRCTVRDELVKLILDSPGIWLKKGKVSENSETDFSAQKESWIAP